MRSSATRAAIAIAAGYALVAGCSSALAQAPIAGMGFPGAGPGAEVPGGAAPRSQLSVSAGADYTSNILRTSAGNASDYDANVGVAFGLHEARPNLQANASGNLQYFDYFNSAFANGPSGGIAGTAAYLFIPDRLSWMVSDNYGQIASQPLEAETPNNRENFNVVQTGPNLSLPFSPRDTLNLQGQFMAYQYGGGGLGNGRQISGSAAFVHRINSALSMSLNYSDSHVEYSQSALYPSYNIQQGFLGLEAKGSRTSLTADLGYSELNYPGARNSGALASLTLTRKIGVRSSLQFQAGTQEMSTAGSFQLDQGLVGIGITAGNAPTIGANDPMRTDYGSAGWSIAGTRTTLTATVTYSRERHQIDRSYNRNYSLGRLDLTRRISPTFTASFGGSYERDNFVNVGVNSHDWEFDANLTWQVNKRLSWRLTGTHYSGGGYLGQIGNYSENLVSISAVWMVFQ